MPMDLLTSHKKSKVEKRSLQSRRIYDFGYQCITSLYLKTWSTQKGFNLHLKWRNNQYHDASLKIPATHISIQAYRKSLLLC